MESSIAQLAGSIYDAAIDPQGWRNVAVDLAQSLNAHQSIILFENDYSGITVVTHGIDPVMVERYQELLSLDLWLAGMRRLPERSTCNSEQFIPLTEYRKHLFYNEVCRPSQADHMVGATIENSPDRLFLIAAQRSTRQGPFGFQQTELIRKSLEHFVRAHFLNRRISELEHVSTSFMQALELSSYATLIVNNQARLMWCNQRAETLLTAGDGISVKKGLVTLAHTVQSEEWKRHVHQCLACQIDEKANLDSAMTIHRPSGRSPYQVLISALTPLPSSSACGFPASVVAFIADPDSPPEVSPKALKAIYGLTNAECRLCGILIARRTVSESADQLGISVHTAKAQLKSIFRKCNVSSQAELAYLLAQVPRAASPID